jgi:hypothetical protein
MGVVLKSRSKNCVGGGNLTSGDCYEQVNKFWWFYEKNISFDIRATLSSQEGFCYTYDGIIINISENKI